MRVDHVSTVNYCLRQYWLEHVHGPYDTSMLPFARHVLPKHRTMWHEVYVEMGVLYVSSGTLLTQ